MFETIAIGNLGRDPEVRTVNTKSGKTQVVDLSVMFQDLKVKLPDGIKLNPWTSVTVWDEREQKWLVEYAKSGSRVQVFGTPEIEVYYSKKNDRWEARVTFPFPDKVKFRSFGSGKNNSSQNQTQNQTQSQNQPQQQTQTQENNASRNDFPEPKDENEFSKLFDGLPVMLDKAE